MSDQENEVKILDRGMIESVGPLAESEMNLGTGAKLRWILIQNQIYRVDRIESIQIEVDSHEVYVVFEGDGENAPIKLPADVSIPDLMQEILQNLA